MRKILLVTSHPDDESFGPGATIAKYAALGAEIHLLCATRGESGKWSGEKAAKSLGEARAKEHAAAAKILGIKKIEYLNYIDGHLS
ncbi:PIG-L family deacetylase, partial [Candidatus Microgenomates bacterium]|nr:PIG-L family deacetylase [Candidatus Microgenomates bacterium]